ncbi:phenylacetate-CoA ligase [Filimonas zeae]|uniref:Phenylacetate-CoA ligase n=1 Tax=Filimonas zeae TaxID=1737353 RepID=A0A917IZG6_9BACT|nr:hypothetical protein [Filimonas zeae]MDR6338637.1 phenylacetate-CoA ligase [Filimonas zeae]GGH67280.1 hypothetical protein GCM10011379_22390 [Filimonas zeae]
MKPKKSETNQVAELVNKLIPDNEWKPRSIEEVIQLPSFYGKLKEFAKALQKEEYSAVDIEAQQALSFRRLQQITNILLLNPMWKAYIGKSGLSVAPNNFEEWQQLPVSDKNKMADFFMGDRPGMVVPLSHGGFEIVASGGTTSGVLAETVYPLKELQETYDIAGDFIGKHMLKNYLTGTQPKWVATTLADYQMWSSGTMVGGVLQKIPGINYVGAGPLNKDVYQHMMSYEGPKAIMGISQGIALLSQLGIGMPEEARKSLKVAMYGSGLLTHLQQKELKALYPDVAILSYFAATQAETIGLQLNHELPGLAAVPGLHFIEVVDENGKWVAEGEEGELVVTRLFGNEAPVIRYKVGDRVIRREYIVTDTLKTFQFEFSGRSGDMIHLGDTQYFAPLAYENIATALKEKGIADLKELAQEIQFVNYRKDTKLALLATVDDPEKYAAKLKAALTDDSLQQLFYNAFASSLSLFNKLEANSSNIKNTRYSFLVKFIAKGSSELHKTKVGKVPLIRDIFQ